MTDAEQLRAWGLIPYDDPDRRHSCALWISRRFQRWAIEKKLSAQDLTPKHFHRFLADIAGSHATRRTRYGYKHYMMQYLDYLFERGLINFDPTALRDHRRTLPVPKHSNRFLEYLSTTLKPASVCGYRTVIRWFEAWMKQRRLCFEDLRRDLMIDLLIDLRQEFANPSSRRDRLLKIRAYLRWMFEEGHLLVEPDRIILGSDLPKARGYLPRPYPIEVDKKIRRRLQEIDGRYERGLLLMRLTGIRVGELVNLEYDCVRTDHKKRRFMKVPLGKLNSERLVPITSETYRLIRKIKAEGTRSRTFLLETENGKKTYYHRYGAALKAACKGLRVPGPIVTHRLRHTYATELLAAGMSLVGVMRILGHKSHQMTLRYVQITDTVLRNEYLTAMDHIGDRYEPTQKRSAGGDDDALTVLNHVQAWIEKTAHDRASDSPSLPATAKRLNKRIQRLKAEVEELMELETNAP